MRVETGFLGNLFYVLTLLLTGYVLYELIKKYRYLDKINQSKIQYFIVGIFLYAGFNIIFNIAFFYLIRDNYKYTQLGDFSAIFFLGFAAYAVMKKGLFDIRVIATETAVTVLSVVLIVRVFVSTSAMEWLFNSLIWILATYGGYVMIRSVKLEIKRRDEVQRLAKKVEEANVHLKELDEIKDNFMSMASHELNTPIAAIEGYLSMILDEKLAGELNPKMKKYLDSVYISSKRLAALVRDLLNVSRIESNRIHLVYEESQIEDLINQAVMEVGSKVREANHTLTFEKPETKLPKTWCDMTRITETVINILGNAIKYTDPGGKITIAAEKKDSDILISVRDNGRGIPAEKRDKVFQKFSQVDVLRDEVKGTGLGMYISKNLIELHKGKIWFESAGEGKGTTFFFTLPILDKKPEDPHEGEGPVLQLK
ncbi:MAG: HAMP domain-containing sensor histidine kinase [Patescibacteria group bacterium]